MHASLCFLSYNRPTFIRQAILTALAGAHEPVEVIVHDDGSTDGRVWETLTELRADGKISTLILNQSGYNQGQGVALNRMFNMASGDPILKLDQDLIFRDRWLDRVREILRDPYVGLLGLFHYHHEPVDSAKTGIAVASPSPTHSYHTHICGSGFAVRREAWETLRPFAEGWESFGEDWDFQKRVDGASQWFNALPAEDLVHNVGFGIGPSTIVLAPETLQTINHGPKLVEG